MQWPRITGLVLSVVAQRLCPTSQDLCNLQFQTLQLDTFSFLKLNSPHFKKLLSEGRNGKIKKKDNI